MTLAGVIDILGTLFVVELGFEWVFIIITPYPVNSCYDCYNFKRTQVFLIYHDFSDQYRGDLKE